MPNSAAYDYVEQSIIDDTGRPDMAELDTSSSSKIMRRIQRAVLAMHRIDFWKRDFIETIYAFPASGSLQVIQEIYLPRIRSIGYLFKYDDSIAGLYQYPTLPSAMSGLTFTEINPAQKLDGYAYDMQDTMYRSGNEIKLNSSTPISKVMIGYFNDPVLSPITASDSWILLRYPDLIAAYVKRRIFKDIGKDDENRASLEEYNEELMRLQTNETKLAVLSQ